MEINLWYLEGNFGNGLLVLFLNKMLLVGHMSLLVLDKAKEGGNQTSILSLSYYILLFFFLQRKT